MKTRYLRKKNVCQSMKRIFHYCAFGLVLSTVAWPDSGIAQQILENLLGRLEQVQGSASSGGSGQGKQDTLGTGEVESRDNGQIAEAVSPYIFDAAERRHIREYCVSKRNKSEEQIFDLGARFSRLEKDYCKRISESIFQFGYELFGVSADQKSVGNGSIQDEYVLGIGDQLIVSFFGRDRKTITSAVDREGRIIVGELPPVSVLGMTFGEFRRWLEKQTEETMFKTKPIVSLGNIKSVSVTVAGEVQKPGVHRLTSLSSILDAINNAGGINKTGSFRRLQVFRGDQIIWVDIYDILLARDGGQNLSLRDGDKIIVPLIGSTVAIAGRVLRPGIYELAEGQKKIPVADILALAGGAIRPKGNSVRQLSFNASGREVSDELSNLDTMASGGDIILVSRREDYQLGVVELSGHVRTPGKRALSSTPTIRSLVQDRRVFRENPYLLFAVLETTDPTTLARRHFPINLQRIIAAEEDFALRENDRLMVFSQNDISFLTSLDVREVIQGNVNEPNNEFIALNAENKIAAKSDDKANAKRRIVVSNTQLTRDVIRGLADRGLLDEENEALEKIEQDLAREQGLGCRGLQSLSKIVQLSGTNRFRNAVQNFSTDNLSRVPDRHVCPRIFDEIPDLLPFVLEHLVAVSGEIRSPGSYPITPNTPLSSIVAVVGGLTRNVDLSVVEVSKFAESRTSRKIVNIGKTSLQSVVLNPGDIAKFNTRFTDRDSGTVFLSGEFIRTGRYDIRRGEKLSEVIARAGGLTQQAFPYGAIFTRERVKIAEKQGFKRAARELKSAAMFAAAGSKGASATSVLALDKITDEIKNAVALGRVVIESDPTVLQVRPELDSVLEPGDRLFIPKRPNSIMIIGDVLNPGALQFIAGTKVDLYIQQAGGLQNSADEDRMFLVFPNGVAQPVSVSAWNYNPVQVPPGSTIVVPKDPAPLDLFVFAKEITALISQMAITAASLAVIGNN